MAAQLYLALLLVAAAVLAFLLLSPALRARRIRRLRGLALPAEAAAELERTVPPLRRMPEALRRRHAGAVRAFLATKRFHGCGGLELDDTMRLTIAGWACLPVLNFPGEPYPALRDVLVYPSAFIVDQEFDDDNGVVSRERRVLSGESWEEGRVLVSWEDVEHAISHPCDSENVVLHEFAHQLDQASGGATGAPHLGGGGEYERWAEALGEAYEDLCERVDRGDDGGVLDPYGATDPGEFFAVATEAFFEAPQALRDEHGGLYAALSRFYRLDPARW